MFKTVLFPVDGSRETREAADVVINIVKTYNSNLVLLSVVNPEATGGMSSETEVAKLLEGAKALFAQQDITVKTLEKTGIPSFTICDVADEINADLMIMGTKGLGLPKDDNNQSVAHRAIDLAPCPVLIVP
ncbi:MAG: universal stress protein [Cyanobacteria bacterium P01_F01_bin.143]